MALAFTHKDDGTSATSPATSGSVAFANSKLYIVCYGATCSAGNTATFSAPTGGGLTFVNVVSTSVARRACSMWCAYVDSGASTGTLSLTVTTAGLTRMGWSIDEVTGSAATAASSGASAFGQTGAQNDVSSATSSVTLGSFADATNNVAYGYHEDSTNATFTAEANYTTLLTSTVVSYSQLVEYFLGQDTTVTATLASNPHSAVAAEIKMAAAGDSVGMIPIF